MDTKTVLEELGLSDGESKVYIALLKLGEAPVNKIKEETKLHRTTIYDFLEKLLNKALVSSVIKEGSNFYRAAHPSKLMDFLKDKESKLQKVLPELVSLSEFEKEDLKVEVYRGKEGFRTLLNLVLKSPDKKHYGFGFDEQRYEDMDPMMRKFFKESQKVGLQEYAFISEEATFTYDYPQIHYKRIPKEYFNPTTITTFGDHVAFHLWDPLSFILINNKQLADSYKKHFKLLWDNPVTTLTGDEAVKRVFTEMAEKLKPGEEYVCFGASNESERFLPLFIKMMKKMNKKDVKSRVIFDEDTIDQIINLIIYKGRVKTLPKEYITPMEVNMYHDTTFFALFSKTPIVMIIKNQEITDSFRKYFEVMWKIAK